jgi:hypothetical protein
MAQGGAAPYLEPGAVRSTSSAHNASDREQAAALGDMATEVSACGGSSLGTHAPFGSGPCAASAARGGKAGRVGKTCNYAACTPGADAVRITNGGAEMSADMACKCLRRQSNGNTSSVGQTPDAARTRGVRQGIGLYQAFNRFGPSRVVRISHSRVIPPVVVDLGELVGLIYRSDKGQPGQPRTYIHFMENPPRLVCDPEGTQLYVVGGSYRVTPQGIEG